MVLRLLGLAVRTFVLETAPHLLGEAQVHRAVVSAEQAFEKAMKEFEFAIEQQKLKREDLRDLVELIGGSMDLSHLVGALLLEFCIAFYCESKLLEEGDGNVPGWMPKLFLLSNIGALGYLLFAVWLALHASVAGHAIGVELLLNHNRLTIPSPELLGEVQESTSMLAQFGKLPGLRWCGGGASRGPRSGRAPPLLALRGGAGGPRADEADCQDHRRMFAERQGQWLGFDAYSRVCMALGMNQMLQSLSYFVIGPIAQHSPSIALISLLGIQTLALLLLKLDVCHSDPSAEEEYTSAPKLSTIAGADDTCEHENDGRKLQAVHRKPTRSSVPSSTWAEFSVVVLTFCMPPVSAGVFLWVHPCLSSMSYERTVSLLVTPCFFMHAAWLLFVASHVAPSAASGLPQRLRTVGYLKVFVRNAQGALCDRPGAESQPFENGIFGHDRGGSPKDPPGPPEHLSANVPESAMPSPAARTPGAGAAPRGARKTELSTRCPVKGGSQGPAGANGHAARDPRDDLAWSVVRFYTGTVVVLWVLGACVHVAECLSPQGGASSAGHGLEKLETRAVHVAWPEPARFFEITALQCNRSIVTISSRFAVYVAQRYRDGSLGELSDAGDFSKASLLCNTSTCSALSRADGDSLWRLAPLQAPSASSHGGEPVPVPKDWSLVNAVWTPCADGACNSVDLAGWDGSEVTIATMFRDPSSGQWRFRRRFAVRPPGDAGAGAHGAAAAGPPRYDDVRALQLSAGAGTLAVLMGSGILDTWSLTSGQRLGRWRVGGSGGGDAAMCHDGRELLVARLGEAGPSLQAARLPPGLRQEDPAGLTAG